MTETPPPPPPGPPTEIGPAIHPGAPATAIASLVVSCVGFCVPFGGLVGVVLGIFGLVVSRKRQSGVGIAVTGIVVGFVAFALHVAIFLPALDKTKQAAHQERATRTLTHIHHVLLVYATDFPDAAPGTDFATELVAANYVNDDIWLMPFAPDDGGPGAFLFGYLDPSDGTVPYVITLDPAHPANRLSGIPVIDSDGNRSVMRRAELEDLLRSLTVHHADGRPWRLPPQQP